MSQANTYCVLYHDMCVFAGRYHYVSRKEGEGQYYIALELSDPQTVDAATYRLNAKNSHGESNANLKLNFDGKQALLVTSPETHLRPHAKYFC